MKKFFIVFQLLISYLGHSQDFVSKGKIEYEMLTSSDGLKNFNAVLYFNENYSKFIANVKGSSKEVIETIKDDNSEHMIVKIHDTTETSIINSLKEKKLYIINKEASIIEENALQTWTLEEESKEIGKLLCNKATCNFRGRSYIAWYASSIPLPYGPWKFNGLPGLILEVYDSKNEVFFSMKNILIPFNEKIVGLTGNEKFISRDEYKVLEREKAKKFIKDMNDKARRIEASAGKNEVIKITVSKPVEKKGIELD